VSPFSERLARLQARVENALSTRLPQADLLPARLHEAMRYATLNGGKRLRAILVYGAGEALGAAPDALDPAACAVELIHSYSLVHDDLPAMDDDDLRRGKPTCHKVYGEATALLAGDALQSTAYQILADDPAITSGPERRLAMVAELARATGSLGMAGGQAIDLDSVGGTLSLPELENMHIHKTGALIRASVALGVLSAPPADAALPRALDEYAKCIGLAFQIQDDILDVEGDTETIGKTSQSDASREKPTYPALLSLAGAKQEAARWLDAALASLEPMGDNVEFLREVARYIVNRNH